MDSRAWWATVQRVTEGQAQLSTFQMGKVITWNRPKNDFLQKQHFNCLKKHSNCTFFFKQMLIHLDLQKSYDVGIIITPITDGETGAQRG